jgi:outer membrane lipoprotein SlyB
MGRSVDGTAVTAPDGRSTNSAAPLARANPATRIAPSQVAERAPAREQCADCGVVESTREVSAKGTGSGVGAVGGAVVGGLLGNQVGSGRGNTVATAIGAVGGAVAGNEVEKRVKATKSREVTVRLDDGSSRVVNEGSSSPWHTGDRVKIVSGEIHAHP